MNYTKDKNIISIYIDDEQKRKYTIDINTGIITGIRGKAVKAMANSYRCQFTDTFKADDLPSLLMRYIRRRLDWNEPMRADVMTFFDKVDSLHDEVVSKALKRWNTLDIALMEYDFKKIINCIRKHPTWDSYNIVDAFRKEEDKAYIGTPNLTDNDIRNLIYFFNTNTVKNIPPIIWHTYDYYMYNQHMKEMELQSLVLQYLKHCFYMEVEPRKNNNVIREFYETKKRYEMMKDEISSRHFDKQYAKHSKAWEFEYGNFIVRIPTTGKDLVKEGAEMHHCVGGYVDRVESGSCYICFIRHKKDPDRPYITCQVLPDGEISQYYLAHDRRISSEEDKDFKKAYQEYLRSVWGD